MSAVVVSDTSPLQYLILTQAVESLPHFFDRVYIPTAVAVELKHASSPSAVRDWIASLLSWAIIQSVSPVNLGVKLGSGEVEAISLALALKVQAVLIDDQKAKLAARRLGLDVVGTLTVLERAAGNGYIDLKAALSALRRTSFHVRPGLLEQVWERHLKNSANV